MLHERHLEPGGKNSACVLRHLTHLFSINIKINLQVQVYTFGV